MDGDGNAITYSGASWGTPVSIDLFGFDLVSVPVSCPSVGFCAAIGASDVVFDGVPSNLGAPQIGGAAIPGSVLSTSTGAWTNGPTSFSYQWEDCSFGFCSPVLGATGPFYTLTTSDVGSTIEVEVTASNAVGASNPASSAPTATVTVSTPPPPAPTPPPTPAPPVAAPTSSPAAAVTHVRALRKRGRVSLRVSCRGNAGVCHVDVRISVTEKLRGGKVTAIAASAGRKRHHRRRVRRKVLVLASRRMSVPAGRSQTLVLRLNAAGRRLLAARRHLRVRLTATTSRHVTVARKTLLLKAVAHRRHRKRHR